MFIFDLSDDNNVIYLGIEYVFKIDGQYLQIEEINELVSGFPDYLVVLQTAPDGLEISTNIQFLGETSYNVKKWKINIFLNWV